MLPGGVLTPTSVPSAYLPPWDEPYEPLTKTTLGGAAVGDGSLGREVQAWTVSLDGDTIKVVDSNGVLGYSLVVPDVVTVSLAFDNNMSVAIAYQKLSGSYLYYYNSLTEQYDTMRIADGDSCLAAVDDNRAIYNANSDVFFTYTRTDGNLYYRQQRDRYLIERLVGPTQGGTLIKCARNLGNRLQWTIDPRLAPPELIT